MSKKKTRMVKKAPNYAQPEHLILNPPYTLFGHDQIRPSFSIILRVGGLRQMLDEFHLDDGDSFRIEIFHDRPIEYSFIRRK